MCTHFAYSPFILGCIVIENLNIFFQIGIHMPERSMDDGPMKKSNWRAKALFLHEFFLHAFFFSSILQCTLFYTYTYTLFENMHTY